MKHQSLAIVGFIAIALLFLFGHDVHRFRSAGTAVAALNGITPFGFPLSSSVFASTSAPLFTPAAQDTSTLGNDSTDTIPAICLPADLSTFTRAIVDAINAANSANAGDASTSSATAPASTSTAAASSAKYQYKYLTSVDECTLNKYGQQGWSVSQIGAVVSDRLGGPYYATDCRTPVNGYVDWAFLNKSPQLP